MSNLNDYNNSGNGPDNNGNLPGDGNNNNNGNGQCFCSNKIRALHSSRASLVARLVKNPPGMQETPVQFLRGEDQLERG